MPVHMEWCEPCREMTRFVQKRTRPDRYECVRCRNRREREEPRQYVLLEYSSQELAATPDYEPTFEPGDLLAEVVNWPRHLGADEIVVVHLEDDVVDSVWPEELRRLT